MGVRLRAQRESLQRGASRSSHRPAVHSSSLSLIALAALFLAGAAQDPKPDPLAVLFETKVRPILVNRCEECHADDADGGLRVDTREGLMKGGDSGAAIL